MRYQLLAHVHGEPHPVIDAEGEHPSIPAVVEFSDAMIHKRVVAIVDTAHELSGDEALSTATMLCAQLDRAFSRRGMSLSMPELVMLAEVSVA